MAFSQLPITIFPDTLPGIFLAYFWYGKTSDRKLHGASLPCQHHVTLIINKRGTKPGNIALAHGRLFNETSSRNVSVIVIRSLELADPNPDISPCQSPRSLWFFFALPSRTKSHEVTIKNTVAPNFRHRLKRWLVKCVEPINCA